MGPAAPDRLADALANLDPVDRALLELSFRRELPDSEIAELLGVSETGVEGRRWAGLEALAAELEAGGAEEEVEQELREAGDEVWQPEAPAGEDEESEEPPGEEGEGEREAEADAPPPRRVGSWRRRLVLLGLAALAVGIAIGVAIATSDNESDEDSSDEPAPRERNREPQPGRGQQRGDAPPAPSRAPRKLGRLVELQPQIAGIEGTVSARLVVQEGRIRLALRARDLTEQPEGGYEVWLFDSPQRAVSLARFRTPDFELNARLPDDFGRHRFLDVSLERRDDRDRGHSGASAFRAPVSELRR